ncbi:MAG: radical SAM protein [Bacilli bacterium]|nr:radical SAM protein [Bacilli bacterium]
MTKYESVGYNQSISLDTIKNPLYVYLELNNKCNLNCKFCSVSKKQNDYIKIEEIKKILDELKKNGILDVYYTGGEPLLHPDFDEIIEYASSLEFRQTLLTNGIVLDRHINAVKKILCVCVSLHGTEQKHNELTSSNCYQRVISNIKLIQKNTNVKINYTVTYDNQNIDEMKSVLEYGKNNSIPVSFSKYNNIGKGKDNSCHIDVNSFVKSLDTLREKGYEFSVNDCIAPCTIEEKYLYLTHGCGAGYIFCSIDYNGNIKICPSSTRYIGNIKKEALKKIWNKKHMKEFRRMKWIPEYCKSCKNLTRCRCGCKIELGNDLENINDYIVVNEMEKIWDKIKSKSIQVNIFVIRKEGKNFISLSNPPRKYDKESFSVINKLNDGIKPEQLIEYKNLIIALYKDGIIKEEV